MKFGVEWRCGNCGKIYTTFELIGLKRVKLVDSDTDPGSQHGYTSACDCGYRFHVDKWVLRDVLKVKIDNKEVDGKETEMLVSTVDLELNHSFFSDKDLWYETGLFVDIENKDFMTMIYEERYENKEEAIAGHNKILQLLKDGKYEIYKSDENWYRISFKEDE